ncbi:MAG: hypothetical protein L3J25_08375 [Flavobacteriaceae bacterium]|nr:hypothetical protein [Flavobacteriaceae bacterium]
MDAEKLDQILEFISQEENRNNNFDAHHLQRDLFPKLNEDQVEQLIFKIDDLKQEVSEILKGEYNTTIYCNGLTKPFLEDGGFTKIGNDIILKNKRIQERERLEIDLAKSNLKANKLNKKIAKRNSENQRMNKKTTWINIIIGLLNVALIAWQILKG